MIGRLALRSLTAHPVRSAVLAGGFGVGVAVMAILLGVAGIVLQQAQSPALVGGGDVLLRMERRACMETDELNLSFGDFRTERRGVGEALFQADVVRFEARVSSCGHVVEIGEKLPHIPGRSGVGSTLASEADALGCRQWEGGGARQKYSSSHHAASDNIL